MFKKTLMPLVLITPALIMVSCVKEVGDLSLKGNIYLNEDILKNNQKLDEIFNVEQLNMLFNKTNFFQNKNQQDVDFQKSYIDKKGNIVVTINDYDYQLSHLKKLAKYSLNYATKGFVENGSTLKYNNLFTNYLQEDMKKADFASSVETKYTFNKDLFIHAYPDLGWILTTIFRNINDNYYQKLLGNLIDFKRIRPMQWFENAEQKGYLEWLIKLYLLYFNFDEQMPIDKVKITSLEKQDNDSYAIKFDLLDSNNNSLIDNHAKQTKFFMPAFRDQLNSPDLKLTYYKIPIDEPKIMFSEYLNNALLKFNDNFYSYSDFDDLIITANNNKRFSARGFKYFLKKYYQDFISLEVPAHKKNEDLKYEIIDLDKITYSDIGLKAKNVLKATVRVYKQDGSTVDYPWYSFDFNSHQHLFKGYHIDDNLNLDSLDNLWSWSNNKYFNIKDPNSTPQLDKGLDANEFYQNHILDLLNLESYRFSKSILPKFNKIKQNIEANELEYNLSYIDYLETFLNVDILSFLIGNQENDFESGIDSVKVKYLGYHKNKAGTILLQIDFLDKNGQSLLLTRNAQQTIEFGGFKGYDFSEIDKQQEINQTFNKSVNYFFDNKIDQLPQIAKWGDK